MTTTEQRNLGSDTTTDSIRVEVRPEYLPTYSDPEGCRYIFAYRVRVTNGSTERITLLSRHWTIVDANGERHEVKGRGVVGQTPLIDPGCIFEYASFCPIPTAWGTMEGSYHFDRPDAEPLHAKVGRFFLVAPTP
ncbi:MAG: Co2+/Mg2+ efflux protein ApaG [Planctomycetota bacterium]|nr:Co2+/Mg2+ efflux protein ApaG [Planctomycetota bacterium]